VIGHSRSAEGLAAEQIGRIDPELLARRLDVEVAVNEGAAFARACEAALPLVTPGGYGSPA
jgi:hypothetical protein